MGRRKQFRPKKAENSGDPDETAEDLKLEDDREGLSSNRASSPPRIGPLPTPQLLPPWLGDLKGFSNPAEGVAARLLQLQRLALQYNKHATSESPHPLDLSSKLSFPWPLPPPPPPVGGSLPPPHLWNGGWFNGSGGTKPLIRPPTLKTPPRESPDRVKDIFRCVWCTESYSTLDELTQHLVDAKHNQSFPQTRSESPVVSKASLPRKLVRGQDVWLGKGQEQTREILKCMWCGQSFKSLADLTLHMQETKHYTKVISQEQITSWKQQQNDCPPQGNAASNGSNAKVSSFSGGSPRSNGSGDALSCKVCEEPCSTLKELTSHMARNNHYKAEGSPSPKPSSGGAKRSRDTETPPPPPIVKEKRKKSLPVRKLLELERVKSEPVSSSPSSSVSSSSSSTTSFSKGKKPTQTREEECSNSILGSLEQMVETSFKSGSSPGPKKPAGLLHRLGIEDEKEEESPSFYGVRMYPRFLSSFLSNNNNNLRGDAVFDSKKNGGDERNSSSSSSSSPLPLRCSLCSDEFGDKENFADHFERKHANYNNPNSKALSSASSPPPTEESSESKFLKYSELAKQLSGR